MDCQLNFMFTHANCVSLFSRLCCPVWSVRVEAAFMGGLDPVILGIQVHCALWTKFRLQNQSSPQIALRFSSDVSTISPLVVVASYCSRI